MTTQLLTNSRADSFKRCRRRHYWEYELGLRPSIDAKALRQGTAYHYGLDLLKRGASVQEATEAIWTHYGQAPEGYDTAAWEFEVQTVACLLSGYAWRWADVTGWEVLTTEQAFRLPLTNPETGAASTVWELAGKIDGVVKLEDGRLAVLEHKTTSEDVAQDSDYWRRLQIDQQISIYIHAARQLGWDCATVLYDVTRKPSIKPTNVPLLDGDGLKIVLDQAGQRVLNKNGSPRQTGDTEKGYAIQSRAMTADEWGEKLTADIGSRPEWYYARVEIPRLDQEINECLAELWDLQKTIREAQNKDRWYRTVSHDTCTFCSYFGICGSKYDPVTQPVPDGFTITENLHPELELTNEQTVLAGTALPATSQAAGQ